MMAFAQMMDARVKPTHDDRVDQIGRDSHGACSADIHSASLPGLTGVDPAIHSWAKGWRVKLAADAARGGPNFIGTGAE
jgi:hypothetical protein